MRVKRDRTQLRGGWERGMSGKVKKDKEGAEEGGRTPRTHKGNNDKKRESRGKIQKTKMVLNL